MVLGGFSWFFDAFGGLRWFLVALIGFWWLVVLSGSDLWFLVIPGVSMHLLVIPFGFWQFLVFRVVLDGSWGFLVVFFNPITVPTKVPLFGV